MAVNGEYVGEHPDARGAQYQEFELSTHLLKKKKDDPSLGHFDSKNENTMALFFKGPTSGYQHCELLFLGADLKSKMTICEGLYAPNELEALKDKGWSKAKKGKHGFWRSSFKTPPLKDVAAVTLNLAKHGRGVVWVNGNCVGRHWKSGNEQALKLPLSWLKPVNEILVLEEEAGLPQEASVHFEPKLSEEKLP